MGDDNRGMVFAQFIIKNFPKAQYIMDVASGKGQVARKLANKKRNVIAIEAHPRLDGRSHKLIHYKRAWFTSESDIEPPDLIVGMHPDEATSEIVMYAVKHHIPFAVVPCCVKGRHSTGLRYQGWLNKLKSLARQSGYSIYEAQLKMTGKNIAIVGKP